MVCYPRYQKYGVWGTLCLHLQCQLLNSAGRIKRRRGLRSERAMSNCSTNGSESKYRKLNKLIPWMGFTAWEIQSFSQNPENGYAG